jgi:DNA primase
MWERNKWNNIVIVEGELNVLAMNQYEIDAVGISGSDFSDYQRDLMIQRCNSAILYLDNDKAGEKGTRKIVEMLFPYMPISIVQNAPGDAAELDKDTVDGLIRNAKSSLELQIKHEL